MVVTLLVDANLDGHAALLDMRLQTEIWRDFRDFLNLHFLYLDQAGLGRTTPDDVVWQFCQDNACFLLTANRNQDSFDSLEATIRRKGQPDSLPVLTLADADEIFRSVTYLDKVIERLLDYLLDQGA